MKPLVVACVSVSMLGVLAAHVVAQDAYLGIVASDDQPSEGGVRIGSVVAGAAAARSGMRPADIITGVGSQEVRDMDELAKILARTPAGATLAFEIERDGVPQELEVTLDRRGAPTAVVQTGAAAPAGKPRLGLRAVAANDSVRKQLKLSEGLGLLVTSVSDGSAADSAGIVTGAVIIAADGRPVGSTLELAAAVERAAAAGSIELTLIKEGKEVRQRIALAAAQQAEEAGPTLPVTPPSTVGGVAGGVIQPDVVAPPDRDESRLEALERRLQQLEDRIEKLEAKK